MDQTQEKRRRRKAIKSCAFCRRRKLRCDQKRPRCSTCIKRKLPVCVYSDGLNHIDDETTREMVPVRAFGESSTRYNIVVEPSVARSKNLLDDFFTLQCKDSGRKIYYGPTSTRTLMAKFDSRLIDRLRQATAKVKKARIAWKKRSNFTMLSELQTIETPLDTLKIVVDLPSYETIVQCVEGFFDQRLIFPQIDALDREKVMRDLQEGLVVGTPVVSGGERPVVGLQPAPKSNYYRLGVIFSILAMNHYREDLPTSFEGFFTYLTGCSTAKTMYVERCQTFLLLSVYRLAHGYNGGDNSHLMLLVDNMITTALYLGLNNDIQTLYRGHESTVGSLASLQALWYWILLADFIIALDIGRPLKISPYDYDGPFADYTDTVYGVMVRFLKIGRTIICELYNRRRTPDLHVHCETLTAFIENEFSPLELYTADNLLQEHRLPHLHILCGALSLLLACYGLRVLILKDSSTSTRNGATKAILVSFSVISSLTQLCFKLDKSRYSHMMAPDCQHLPPHSTGSISIWCTLFIRSMLMFYAFAYAEMTLFEGGLLFVQPTDTTDECDLSMLRSTDDREITLNTYIKIACQKLDILAATDNPTMKMILRRSRFYVMLMGKDKVLRTLTQMALACRTNAESSWLSNSKVQQNFPIPNLQSPELSIEPTPETNKLITQPGECESTISDNITVNQLQESLMASPSADPEMAQMIADEFWQSYNLGWQEILDSAEAIDLISDFMI